MLSAVRCHGVTRDFSAGGATTRALRGVALEAHLGELTLLAGPSGCGKTTLLSIVAGLLEASSGDVEVLGHDLAKMSTGQLVAFRRANLGFVFQQYNLLPALTAAENAAVPLLIAGVARAEALERARKLLGEVGLSERADHLPAELSGGQQQRVALARALVHGPRLVICDEPTAALDAHSGRTVMELLRAVAVMPDRAVLVVTHDSRVFPYADRVVQMDDGMVVS